MKITGFSSVMTFSFYLALFLATSGDNFAKAERKIVEKLSQSKNRLVRKQKRN